MKKHLAGILGMYAVVGIRSDFSRGVSNGDGDRLFEKLSDNEKKVIPKNHKKFTIQGITVTALSHKRAVDKVRKLLANDKKK